MSTNNSILTIGSVALDSLEIQGKHYTDILGGSATYFSLAAGIYAPVHLSSVVGKDFPSNYIELFKSRNINLDNFYIVEGNTFRWGGKYSKDLKFIDGILTMMKILE